MKFLYQVFIAFTLLLIVPVQGQTHKSFIPKKHWLDNNNVYINAHGGGITFYDGVYYWFGEHKIPGKLGNKAQVGVRVYSSTDLYNWNNEGVALKVDTINMNSDIVKGSIIERPKVIFNESTNQFVMWFHL